MALVAVEVGVRVLAPLPARDVTPPPLLRGELTTPGDHEVRTREFEATVHVNAEGFVDREWGPKAGPRVVVIGDSFVQAAQVDLEEGFGRVLARETGVEVLSMGVPGAGTATALGVLERYALPKDPDVVLLGFLVANDVLNNHPLLEGKDDKPFFALRDGELVPVDAEAMVAPRGAIWEISHTLRWIGRTLATRAASKRKLELGKGMPVDLRVHDPACAASSEGDCAAWAEAWAVTEALIAEMAARCAAAGVRFGVVLFPDGIQATEAGRARAKAVWPRAAGWDFTAAQDRARAMASRHAPTLDLLPALAAADCKGCPPLYFAVDGHWTARGHAVAAEGAAGFVGGVVAR